MAQHLPGKPKVLSLIPSGGGEMQELWEIITLQGIHSHDWDLYPYKTNWMVICPLHRVKTQQEGTTCED